MSDDDVIASYARLYRIAKGVVDVERESGSRQALVVFGVVLYDLIKHRGPFQKRSGVLRPSFAPSFTPEESTRRKAELEQMRLRVQDALHKARSYVMATQAPCERRDALLDETNVWVDDAQVPARVLERALIVVRRHISATQHKESCDAILDETNVWRR